MRAELNEAMKTAMKNREQRTLSTIRMILARLKEKDIEARAVGRPDGIDDAALMSMLQAMVKQRRDSIELYKQGGRQDLVDQEAEEITVIERFLPQQMDEAAMAEAIRGTIGEIGAAGIKDMGRTMAALKERYAGSMDFQKASGIVKQMLAG